MKAARDRLVRRLELDVAMGPRAEEAAESLVYVLDLERRLEEREGQIEALEKALRVCNRDFAHHRSLGVRP